MTKILCVLLALTLTGCMAAVFGTADQLNQISIGMTKEDVVKKLGPPKTTAAADGIEYMQYRWVKTVIAADGNFPEVYYVAIKNGLVTSFGRKGDFDSTKVPTRRVEVDQTIRQEGPAKDSKDLYAELKKLQDLKNSGIITEEEFKAQKKKLLEKN